MTFDLRGNGAERSCGSSGLPPNGHTSRTRHAASAAQSPRRQGRMTCGDARHELIVSTWTWSVICIDDRVSR